MPLSSPTPTFAALFRAFTGDAATASAPALTRG